MELVAGVGPVTFGVPVSTTRNGFWCSLSQTCAGKEIEWHDNLKLNPLASLG